MLPKQSENRQVTINLGYIAMNWAIDAQSWYVAFRISGSSLLTLGFALADTLPTRQRPSCAGAKVKS